MNAKTRVPALAGWFTMDEDQPHLLGSRCTSCGTYYFPRQAMFCRNPACAGEVFEEVKLSRTGKVWSFTNACYRPPEPYVSADPFVPFAIAAVELDKERMIVLGQVVREVGIEGLRVGTPVELVLQTLSEDETCEQLVWKWKPVTA